MRSFVSLSILACVSAVPAHATTYRVNSSGTADFPTIQAAIQGAAPGDTIALADGIYTGDGNRDVSFLGKAVVVRSAAGDPAGCTVDAQGSPTEPHRGVLFQNAEGPGSVLEGITVRGGFQGPGCQILPQAGNPPPFCPTVDPFRPRDAQGPPGGGIYCGPSAGPTLRNCLITGNEATTGGGLVVSTNSHPAIVDCVFEDNHACAAGGGIGYEFRPDSSEMTVTNCLFRSNTADAHGGGVALGGRNRFVGCTFVTNRAQIGAGFFTCSGSTGAVFSQCTFVRNEAVDWPQGSTGWGGGGAT